MNLNEKIIRNKVGLLKLAEELDNVSKACQVMGLSRDTFHRYKNAVEEGGVKALIDKNRRVPNHKNRVDEHMEKRICDAGDRQSRIRTSACSQRTATRRPDDLRRRRPVGVAAPPAANLQTAAQGTRSTRRQNRQRAHREAQVVALERKADHEVIDNQIESAHPGYLGCQDTFYVGTIKGVGRIYQQTYIDAYSKVACAKLYTTKTPVPAADLLNERVLPLHEESDMGVLRILTDRGTEYCGRPEQHPYELYLAINNIDHTKTKAKSPQTNGICERFHKTILQEFYQVPFRKKLYQTIETLQRDLDEWMRYYNHQRTHQGKMCCGPTPWQTWLDAIPLWKQKVDALNQHPITTKN